MHVSAHEQTIYSHAKYGLETYPKSENCSWNIKTDENKCIYLFFQEFQLENSDENLDKKECE